MTVEDFKRRWILSKINPILFYLPLGGKHSSDKARITISPRTQIEMRTFAPYPDNPDFIVPFYTFFPNKDDSIVTGNLKKYRGRLDITDETGEYPTYGCCFRIYKEFSDSYNPETASGFFPVTAVGEKDEEESFNSIFFNETTLYLPEGTYYYKEEVSSEGDMIFFDTLKIKVFKKSSTYEELEDVIKDYSEEETPADTNILYIQYVSQDDGKLHETFNGYKGYVYKERGKTPEEDSNKEYFKYYIYHNPKCIKVYTKYKETYEAMKDAQRYAYDIFAAPSGWGPNWEVGPIGKMPSDSQDIVAESTTDNIIKNNMYTIVPEVYKLKIMDKEISDFQELDRSRSSYTYFWNLEFAYNYWIGTSTIYDRIGYVLWQYRVTYPEILPYKNIMIGNVLVCNSYIMSYSQYQVSSFSKALIDDHEYDDLGYLYTGIEPSAPVSGPHNSNLHRPESNIGVGLAIERQGEANRLRDDILVRAKTENQLGQNIIKTTKQLEDTIYTVNVKTSENSSLLAYTNMNGESDSYTVTVDLKEEAQSYASPEDCAYFAVPPSRVLSSKYDKDNIGGYCAFMCSEDASHIFYDITCYEDQNDNPILVDTKTYNIETGYHVDAPLYTKKDGTEHSYWRWDQVKDLKTGCGVSILFNRQTRNFYQEWMGASEDIFPPSNTYSYNGQKKVITVFTGEEKKEE